MQRRSIAAPEASPLTRFEPNAPYPFEQIVGRESEESELENWLMASSTREALGGAALVTGFRGVGKTSLVNKVLFDVGLASLHGVARASSNPVWGPFGKATRKKFESAPKEPGPLLVPIRVDIARPISAEALMRRIVRRTYFALVEHGIGALDARVVQRARAAYLRSLGEMSVETTERVKVALGIDTKTLQRLTLEVDMEAEFAETIRQVVSQLSVEEAEDEILEIFDATSAPLGARTRWADLKVWGRTPVVEALQDLAKGWGDRAGVRVRPVLVLDELDKLEPPDARGIETEIASTQLTGTWGYEHPWQLKGTVERPVKPPPPPSSESMGNASEIVRLLKTLFSSRNLSAIAIGGWSLEDEWLSEQAQTDPMLRSIFSRHVYVRSARPVDLDGLVPAASGKTKHLREYVALRTRGRYKDAIRVATELDRDHHASFLRKLEPLLAGWGTFEAEALRGDESPTELIEAATSLEDLVRGVSASLPALRTNRFGVDYVRAVIAGAALEAVTFGDPHGKNAATVAGERAQAEAERVPSVFLRQAVLKLGQLIQGDLSAQ